MINQMLYKKKVANSPNKGTKPRHNTVDELCDEAQLCVGPTIGKGAFGKVALVSAPTDSKVKVSGAVKFNFKQCGPYEHTLHERIANLEKDCEAKNLRHPNLVAGGINKEGHLVMRLYAGTLKELLDLFLNGGTYRPQKDYLQMKLLSDLVHSSYSMTIGIGAVHRDIHSGNIFIKLQEDDIQFLLGDYGKAQFVSPPETNQLSKSHQMDLLRIISVVLEFRNVFISLERWHRYVGQRESDVMPSDNPNIILKSIFNESLIDEDPIFELLSFATETKTRDDFFEFSLRLCRQSENRKVPLDRTFQSDLNEIVKRRRDIVNGMVYHEDDNTSTSPWS